MKLKYKYIAWDFDGTIAYDEYPNIGALIPGAKDIANLVKSLGGEISIWTCRTDKALKEAKEFLDKNEFPYDYFNEPFPHNVNEYGGDHSRKIFADCYIDDRCLLWNGGPVDYRKVLPYLFELEKGECYVINF